MVPFVFVYSPAMLLVGKAFTWGEFFETTIGCLVGILMLAAALSSYGLAPIRGAERLLLVLASVLVISPSRVATLTGLALALPILLRQLMAARQTPTVAKALRGSG